MPGGDGGEGSPEITAETSAEYNISFAAQFSPFAEPDTADTGARAVERVEAAMLLAVAEVGPCRLNR